MEIVRENGDHATDRIAIVTGTSSGIGRAVADHLVDSGWTVLGVSRRSVESTAGSYDHLQIDLADISELKERLLPAVEDRLTRRTWARVALVNNAADPGQMCRLDRMDGDLLNRALTTNVLAPVLLMGLLLRVVPIETPVRIVNVSSGAATVAYPALGDYAIAKAGLRMAGMIAAEERGARADFAVLSYAPGVVDTPMQTMARTRDPNVFPLAARFQAIHESGALVSPDAVAREIAGFLESREPPVFSESRFGGGQPVRLKS